MVSVDGGLRRGFASMAVPPMKESLAYPRRRTRMLSRPLAVAAAAAVLMAIAAGIAWVVLREPGSSPTAANEGQTTREAQPGPMTPALHPDGTAGESAARELAADEAVQVELERLANAERLPRAVDELPAWKVEQLKRALLYSHGIVPGRDG